LRYLVFQLCGEENHVKGWTRMVPFYVGSIPQRTDVTDRLGNDLYIYNEESLTDISLFVFEITDWSTREVMHHDCRDVSYV